MGVWNKRKHCIKTKKASMGALFIRLLAQQKERERQRERKRERGRLRDR